MQIPIIFRLNQIFERGRAVWLNMSFDRTNTSCLNGHSAENDVQLNSSFARKCRLAKTVVLHKEPFDRKCLLAEMDIRPKVSFDRTGYFDAKVDWPNW